VLASAPQLPLKPFLKPSSTILSLKKSLILSSTKLTNVFLYLPA